MCCRLYNKESLLLALLDKKNLPEIANHIRSLKDVVELQLTPNPVYKPVAKGMSGVKLAAEYVCPVSGLEMTGLHRWGLWGEGTMFLSAQTWNVGKENEMWNIVYVILPLKYVNLIMGYWLKNEKFLMKGMSSVVLDDTCEA